MSTSAISSYAVSWSLGAALTAMPAPASVVAWMSRLDGLVCEPIPFAVHILPLLYPSWFPRKDGATVPDSSVDCARLGAPDRRASRTRWTASAGIVLIEEVVPGQVFEPDRPHKSLHVLGRRLKTKALVTGLKAARRPDMPSKPVWGRKLAGGFDSRPPPPLKLSSDERLCSKTRASTREATTGAAPRRR